MTADNPAAAIAWDALDKGKYASEPQVVQALHARQPLSGQDRSAIRAEAVALVLGARASARKAGLVENFLQEYSLGTREGLALMCLAEALLRTPDAATRDRLIAEKISAADWAAHVGGSDSLLVNASTWGLMLTGRLIDVDDETRDVKGVLKRLTARIGEPVVRQAVIAAVRIMGEQFVLGRTIGEALSRAAREDMLCSFDMLGEGARTAEDAQRYEHIYAQAIAAVGEAAGRAGPEAGHGVSVKLSALCPRYEATQEARAWEELYPRLRRLALLAASHDLNFAIDAEEADRLTLSLALIEGLIRDEAFANWSGFGVVVQAYQKRAPQVIAALADLAWSANRRIMVRLVKGAYWDSEVKRAQVAGRADYPVFTTKAATDLSYIVCARALIDAAPALYPQFATHNAHTLAAVRHMARASGVKVEFQRLHGMGEALYEAARERHGDFPVRAYAPVGGHEDLLPYLVRRLLENGANTSFVHRLLDEDTPAEDVVGDPIAAVEAGGLTRHPRIPAPPELYGDRLNSFGPDLSIRADREALCKAAGDLGEVRTRADATEEVIDPARGVSIGRSHEANRAEIDAAFDAAHLAQPAWDEAGGPTRALVLEAMAQALETHRDHLIALCVREAGKTLADGIAEVREAADFCRYYALLARTRFAGPQALKGPAGETNSLELRGRGVFACISPWNFPLAIFTGQVAAALAAGNAVVAKPAEQTPLIAAEAVRLFHGAGLDPRLLALVPGRGETVGAALVGHPRCDGVAFTGGTETAASINRALAGRPGAILPFIAETGGLNGMFVDTTALREQVIDDVILSAFGSAGQRCSALRLLFLPEETADGVVAGLKGAMDALVVGDPVDPRTDVGPLIDQDAQDAMAAHLERLQREGRILHRIAAPDRGHFFGPVLAEIPSALFLEREVFGPILHVVRYGKGELAARAAELASRGYGLTLGVHSRIDAFARQIRSLVPAGNLYVNRSIIGAVVGVQPFGGEGLSGTGPKAGGPNALIRYATERTVSVNIAAQGGDPALLDL